MAAQDLEEPLRIGLVWRGSRSVDPRAAPRADRLDRLTRALQRRRVVVEPIAFEDGASDDVREQLFRQHGVLVWVNPIQDGVDRSRLDAILRDASAAGVWVSADPAVILALGTKEVLYRTRDVGWGGGVELYGSPDDLRARFPSVLARDGLRVLKQARGSGGNGVWKVELLDRSGVEARVVRVQHAITRLGEPPEEVALATFLDWCDSYFAWSGSVVDQPFQPRLRDGMIRCYLVHDRVVGYCHQWPTGLLDPTERAPPDVVPDPAFAEADAPAYSRLGSAVEQRWVPRMLDVLSLRSEQLPVIWDADFLYGPRSDDGENTYVLCEINVSAVWPFPEQATRQLADAAVARTRAARAGRAGRSR